LRATALVIACATLHAQPAHEAEQPGVSGTVVTSGGTPVSAGLVAMHARTARVVGTIERDGRFRIVPSAPGAQQLSISVPGFAPFHAVVHVPPSRIIQLPPLTLAAATYFRAKFVSAAGEPIIAPQLRRLSFDADGAPIVELSELAQREQLDADGGITVGPLPPGTSTLAIDAPPFARMRLQDVTVVANKPSTDQPEVIDGGTVVVPPGATLHVDVVDGANAAVPSHDVFIEDARALSPLGAMRAITNAEGRATFERLGPGRYRLGTRTVERCGGQTLVVTRTFSSAGAGTLRTRMVIGGSAHLRVSTPFAPLGGVSVAASTDATSPAATVPTVSRLGLVLTPGSLLPGGTACRGFTDAEGRVTLPNFPLGPARVDVRLQQSTYVRRVTVVGPGNEIALSIPQGVLPLRVADSVSKRPVANADISWNAGGAAVDARSNATGEALLEAVGTAQGTLAVKAAGYYDFQQQFSEPPGTLYEAWLSPKPPSSLELRVLAASGAPIANAVVVVAPAGGAHTQIAVTSPNGDVSFADLPPATVHVSASAPGFVTAAVAVADRRGVVLTLTPQ
jgi:hypothetical protein